MAYRREAGEAMHIKSKIMTFKHTWASKLKEAIQNIGLIALVQRIMSPLALLDMGAEMAAVVETAERPEPARPFVYFKGTGAVNLRSPFW
jgi:hypothetical protein